MCRAGQQINKNNVANQCTLYNALKKLDSNINFISVSAYL